MYHLCHWLPKKGDRQPPVMQLVRRMQPMILSSTTPRVALEAKDTSERVACYSERPLHMSAASHRKSLSRLVDSFVG
jgi:hypothetical protein